MAKNEISDYDETNANNTDISGIAVSNSSLIAQIDDIVRAQMGALKRWFRSDLFRLRDSTDQTKLLAFGLSGLTTSTTRTLTVQDKDGTIAVLSDLIESYATTVTAAGTTTLTVTSARNQYFTGTTTQTVVLPVTSTLVLGQRFRIMNNATGKVTVQSSGANTIQVMGGTGVTYAPGAPGTELLVTCISLTGTGTASWAYAYSTPKTDWVAYTPTFTGFGTVSGVVFLSRRVGDTLEIRGKFTSGTPNGLTAQITLGYNGANGGVVISSTKNPSRLIAGVGVTSALGAFQATPLADGGIGYLQIGAQSSSTSGLTPLIGSSVANSGDIIAFKADVPIEAW